MFYQIFLSPQVKRCAIITYKHGIYELQSDLRQNFRKLGNIRKESKLHKMIAQRPAPSPPPHQNENSANSSKKPR